MSQQLGSEQSQLNHTPTSSFGVDNLQVPEILSGSSQLQNPLYGSIHTDPNVGGFPSPWLDLGRSPSSSVAPFHGSAATTSRCQYDFDMDANSTNQIVYGDMEVEWNTDFSLGNPAMTETSANFVPELGNSANPAESNENSEDTPKSQLASTTVGINTPPPRTFGPSRPYSLLPARRGGRKGPRSAEEKKNRREAKEQGVCIRCRKMKERVTKM